MDEIKKCLCCGSDHEIMQRFGLCNVCVENTPFFVDKYKYINEYKDKIRKGLSDE